MSIAQTEPSSICEHCGQPFMSKGKGLPQRFCSTAHQLAAWRKRKRETTSTVQSFDKIFSLTGPPVNKVKPVQVFYVEVDPENIEVLSKYKFDNLSPEEKEYYIHVGRWVGKCALPSCNNGWELPTNKIYCSGGHNRKHQAELKQFKIEQDNMRAVSNAQDRAQTVPPPAIPYEPGPTFTEDELFGDILSPKKD